MTMKELFTSFQGRIGRQQFWIGSLLIGVVFSLIATVIVMAFGTKLPPDPAMSGYSLQYDLGGLGGTLMAIVSVFYIWAALAVSIKRWHDRDKSGWWILIGLVPVIGGLWVLIENGFLKGTVGPNSYGNDPLV